MSSGWTRVAVAKSFENPVAIILQRIIQLLDGEMEHGSNPVHWPLQVIQNEVHRRMSRFLASFPAFPNKDAKNKTKNMAMTNQCTDSEKIYTWTMGGTMMPGATSHVYKYIYIYVNKYTYILHMYVTVCI